ncbi:trypsin-7-like [Leptidea sinapis]|uniref:trypsin-7-like n=1 Tax=Leptidea sinapis TaxID=189913 RepID=UPI00212BDF86|nr:trypsin-7-like [Leptidea sinapis]
MKRELFVATLALIHLQGYAKGTQPNESFEIDDKIFGGHETTIEAFPYQAVVLAKRNGQFSLCGGSILNEEYILTSANCVAGKKVFVKTGNAVVKASIQIAQLEPGTYQIHPDYNFSNDDYGIAIIKLKRKMKLDGKIRKAVELIESGADIPAGTNITVSGWGRTVQDGQFSTNLRAVTTTLQPDERCKRIFSQYTPRMICGERSEGAYNACKGDFGSPVVITKSKKQIGTALFSATDACASVIYAKIANGEIRNWIKSVTGV